VPVTAAQAKDLYNTLETAVVEILKDQTTGSGFLTGAGFTLGRNADSIEAGLRDFVRDYQNDELPALAVQAQNSADEDIEAESALGEITTAVDMSVFIVMRGASLKDTVDQVQRVSAAVAEFLREQIGNDSELNTELGGGTEDAVIRGVRVNNDAQQSKSEFEVVAEVAFTVEVDICVT
jgi:hypothetical protein